MTKPTSSAQESMSCDRYCPLEVPPKLCTRHCGMGACERATSGLQPPYVTPQDYMNMNDPEVQQRYADAAKEWKQSFAASLPAFGKCPTPGCPEPEDGNSPTGQCMECVGEAYAEAERAEMELQAERDGE